MLERQAAQDYHEERRLNCDTFLRMFLREITMFRDKSLVYLYNESKTVSA